MGIFSKIFGGKSSNTTASVPKWEPVSVVFNRKIQTIFQDLNEYQVRRYVSPDELEQAVGMQIYTRGGCYAEPNPFTYVLFKDGYCMLIINLWEDYNQYRRYANGEIRRFCKEHGFKMLDFFGYLPNEPDYMEERIRKALG